MQHEPRLQLLTEQQSDCEAFFSEPPWGPGFSNSKEMNHKKQWWAVKTSVCKAQGGMNTTGICGWMRRGENLLQCRQLCGNPSMVTVFGHSLWDQAKDLGQGKMSTWQRRKDTGLRQLSLLFWVSTHSKYLGVDKAHAGTSQLLGPLLLIRSLWAEWASGQATDTLLLWRKNSNHCFPAFLIIWQQRRFKRMSGPD